MFKNKFLFYYYLLIIIYSIIMFKILKDILMTTNTLQSNN